MTALHRQPDDPGTYSPVRFESTGGGREVALLGSIRIAEILPTHGRMLRASVLIRLPDAPRTMFGCTSVMAARNEIARQARDWIEAAGLREF